MTSVLTQQPLLSPSWPSSEYTAGVNKMYTAPSLCSDALASQRIVAEKPLYWYVANSATATCKPTTDHFQGEFSNGVLCAASALANYSPMPDPHRPRAWICTNPVLGICQETQNVGVPFSYKTYATYEQCVSDPQNKVDSSVMMAGPGPLPDPPTSAAVWYLDAYKQQCLPSRTLWNAPFPSKTACEARLSSTVPGSTQIPLQYSRPLMSTDAYNYNTQTNEWAAGQTSMQMGGASVPSPPLTQYPLNPPGKFVGIGQNQLVPGAAGQGYSILS